jgi:hypothetical protein
LAIRFFVREEGLRIARVDDLAAAYLSGDGWVDAAEPSELAQFLLGIAPGESEAGWRSCTEAEVLEYQRDFFNSTPVDAGALGLRARLDRYFRARDLTFARRKAPHGPAPRLIRRGLQREAQRARRELLPEGLAAERLEDLVDQARRGYEREEARIDNIQQRATFFLGATGLTTSLVLVNGSLIYGKEALPLVPRIVAGSILILAAIALVLAGLAALDATTISFDRALPNSAWQIGERMRMDLEDARRDHLSALLLAAQRAESIGDWKLRQLKAARLFFGLAVALVVLVSMVVVTAAVIH